MQGRLRKLGVLAAIGVVLTATVGISQTPSVQAGTLKVLILDTTISGGAGSDEAVAASNLGYTVDIVNAATWGAMTGPDFAAYAAIILGDPDCSSSPTSMAAAEANKAVWGPVVTGNVVAIGTDEVTHSSQGGLALTNSAVAFAVADSGNTGALISLSCYYHGTAAGTPVPVLDPFGTFTVTGVIGCFNDIHIVATHPAIAGLLDSDLENWGCSVHEAFDAWPASFKVLAIAETGTAYSAPDGSVGTPYIVANGEGLVLIGEETPTATPEEDPATDCLPGVPGLPCGDQAGGGDPGSFQPNATPVGGTTDVPTAVPSTAPPPPAPTATPTGGRAGTITAPDTGTGDGTGGGSPIAWLLAAGVIAATGGGVVFAGRRVRD